MKKKIITSALALLVVATGIVGCTKTTTTIEEVTIKEEPTVVEASEVIAQDTEKETINVLVGTMGTYSPFSYYDEDNNLTGYDIEVVRKIEEVDPSLFKTIKRPKR